jgi:hypothetical protein
LVAEVKQNPVSGEEFIEAYGLYREENPFPNLEPEVLKDFLMELLEKENRSVREFLKNAEQIKQSENKFTLFSKKGSEDSFDSFLTIDSVSTKDLSKLNNLDLNLNSLNHNKNWLYAFAENFFAYSYDITYYIFENYLYNDAPHIKHKKY